MDIGFVGGRVEIAQRLAQAGFRVVASGSTVDIAKALRAPRVVILDLADGFATELAIQDAWPECEAGDVIVDVGPAAAADGQRRAAALASVRMHFVDATLRGETLSAGGDVAAISLVAACFDALAERWTHVGPSGSGYHAGRREL
jgi:6-phosphogluconate dehydrogenase (decarboxylating)